jgi:hypothetical protein
MPNFTSKNASESIFWNERFAENYMPWDGAGVPLELQQFVQDSKQAYSCFIPGCGLGYEVQYLAYHDWNVQAIDFAPAAVEKARQFLGPLGHYVQQADFFEFQSERGIDCIYERAFFCALPPHLRIAIVTKWAQLLPINGLLIGYFYLDDALPAGQTDIKGPPFLTTKHQLDLLLNEHFECLEMRPAQASISIFAGREFWMVWRRK